jgi:hypothetical protein
MFIFGFVNKYLASTSNVLLFHDDNHHGWVKGHHLTSTTMIIRFTPSGLLSTLYIAPTLSSYQERFCSIPNQVCLPKYYSRFFLWNIQLCQPINIDPFFPLNSVELGYFACSRVDGLLFPKIFMHNHFHGPSVQEDEIFYY